MSLPSAVFHTLIDPSDPPPAILVPSGLRLMGPTGAALANSQSGVLLGTSHTLAVLSELPEASIWPLRLKATAKTRFWFPAGPPSVLISLPLRSHSLIVLSKLPVAIIFPSGLKATA